MPQRSSWMAWVGTCGPRPDRDEDSEGDFPWFDECVVGVVAGILDKGVSFAGWAITLS